MSDDLRQWLDGELDRMDLDPVLEEDAEAWDRLIDAFRVEHPTAGSAPPWLEQRVMAEIDALPARGAARRTVEWLLRPHPVRISPMAVGLVAATVALVTLLPGGTDTVGVPPTVETRASASQSPGTMVVVEFRIAAPGASSVALAGDFTSWSPDHQLEDLNGDGVWTGRVAVTPGMHTYMFVIDGSEWVSDPHAERFLDDGFGNRNAVLAVTTPSA